MGKRIIRKEHDNAIIRKRVRGGNYSTTEQKTGQYWIDGKEIYRKVIDFGALPNATYKNVQHGISNLDTVVRQFGFTNINGTILPIPAANPDPQYSMTLQTTSSIVTVMTGTNRTSYNAIIILEYTKSS